MFSIAWILLELDFLKSVRFFKKLKKLILKILEKNLVKKRYLVKVALAKIVDLTAFWTSNHFTVIFKKSFELYVIRKALDWCWYYWIVILANPTFKEWNFDSYNQFCVFIIIPQYLYLLKYQYRVSKQFQQINTSTSF